VSQDVSTEISGRALKGGRPVSELGLLVRFAPTARTARRSDPERPWPSLTHIERRHGHDPVERKPDSHKEAVTGA
jgi:hypothetical protein